MCGGGLGGGGGERRDHLCPGGAAVARRSAGAGASALCAMRSDACLLWTPLTLGNRQCIDESCVPLLLAQVARGAAAGVRAVDGKVEAMSVRTTTVRWLPCHCPLWTSNRGARYLGCLHQVGSLCLRCPPQAAIRSAKASQAVTDAKTQALADQVVRLHRALSQPV